MPLAGDGARRVEHGSGVLIQTIEQVLLAVNGARATKEMSPWAAAAFDPRQKDTVVEGVAHIVTSVSTSSPSSQRV
jgi:hypothetical protein